MDAWPRGTPQGDRFRGDFQPNPNAKKAQDIADRIARAPRGF
ncbi:hypothetical protein ACWEV4_09450 [Streptomyces sp. NPDC003860]